MNDLLKKKCVPCEGGVIPFNISEIHKYQKKVDGKFVWQCFRCGKKYFVFIENGKTIIEETWGPPR